MRSLDLLAAHLVGDYVLQTNYQATNKLSDPYARAEHVTTYHIPFLIAGVATRTHYGRLAAFLVLSWIAHFATDSRRWASGEEWPPKPILVDQAIHIATLTALNRVLGRSKV